MKPHRRPLVAQAFRPANGRRGSPEGLRYVFTRSKELGRHVPVAAIVVCLAAAACRRADRSPFASDLAFLRQHTAVVVLRDASSDAQVVVAPGYQGRVMTSTTGGPDAPSFGWIGRTAIQSPGGPPDM